MGLVRFTLQSIDKNTSSNVFTYFGVVVAAWVGAGAFASLMCMAKLRGDAYAALAAQILRVFCPWLGMEVDTRSSLH